MNFSNTWTFKANNTLVIYIGSLIFIIIVAIGLYSQLILFFTLLQRIEKKLLYFNMNKKINFNQEHHWYRWKKAGQKKCAEKIGLQSVYVITWTIKSGQKNQTTKYVCSRPGWKILGQTNRAAKYVCSSSGQKLSGYKIGPDKSGQNVLCLHYWNTQIFLWVQ